MNRDTPSRGETTPPPPRSAIVTLSPLPLQRPVHATDLRHIRTGLDFSEDFWMNREAASDSRTNVKSILLVNGLRFVFSTQKEPVHKSHLLMKPTTLGALHVCATIVNSLVKDVFFCNYFPLRCPRRGWKVAHETLLTFIFYSVIILGWEVWWHSFFLGWQLPPRATPVDVSRVPKPPVVLLQRGSRLPGGGRYVSSVSCVSCVSLLCPYLVSFLSSSSMIIS